MLNKVHKLVNKYQGVAPERMFRKELTRQYIYEQISQKINGQLDIQACGAITNASAKWYNQLMVEYTIAGIIALDQILPSKIKVVLLLWKPVHN
jgi:hypothetical protein